MIYRDFQDLKLSALGLGTMRLPVVDGQDGAIDEPAAQRLVDLAMERGVNYYDTAWGYHSGNSELVMGRALRRYPRNSFHLATKFPGYDLSNMDKVEEIFEKQLEKCQVAYFDFYLFHNVCEANIDAYLDPQYGIHDYLMKQKASGRIRHLGFSTHGSIDTMKRFLDAYGEDMEFCQIQLNYLDWTLQDGKGKVALLNGRGIPIWVMEPVRGGRLAKMPAEDAARLAALRPEETIPAWAFRFLQAVPGVTEVLSGMSTPEQLEDNTGTFSTDAPLTPAERDVLLDIVAGQLKKKTAPCTACRYCVDHCTQGLDIPKLLGIYNEHTVSGGGFIPAMLLSTLPEDKRPGACVGCRSCEAVCPQQIKVSEVLSDFSSRLG